MKKENIIIIILLILTLGLSGYIIYDKTNNKETDKKETANNTINNENSKPLNSEFLSKFSGQYSYEETSKDYTCTATNDYPKTKINFELKEDGTFSFSINTDCAGGYITNGNYYLGDDKIYLISNDCLFTSSNENSLSHDNCQPVEEIYYSINNYNVELYSFMLYDKKITFKKN